MELNGDHCLFMSTSCWNSTTPGLTNKLACSYGPRMGKEYTLGVGSPSMWMSGNGEKWKQISFHFQFKHL